MGLVKGFSDILSPVNLAVNGQFAINQRQNFTSLTPAKVGDVVSDGWKVYTCDTESLSVFNNTGLGHLNVTGSGKKGQSVFLYNFAAAFELFALDNYWHNFPATASVTAIQNPGSIPLRVSVTPAQLTGSTYVVNNSKNIYAPGNKTQVSSVINNAAAISTWSSGGGIYLILLADGPFDIYLTNFQHLFGCFYNPPDRCPVPYSEDLLRCQRYYQKGTVHLREKACMYVTSTGRVFARRTIPFFAMMAGTPSVTMDYYKLDAFNGTGFIDISSEIGTTSKICSTANITSSKFEQYLDWTDAINGPYMANNGLEMGFNWEASV